MKQKSLFVGGLVLSIFYAFFILVTMGLVAMAVGYDFLSEIEFNNEILDSLLKSVSDNGKTTMMVVFGIMLVFSIYLEIVSISFTKYSKLDKNILEGKRIKSIIFLISYFVAMAGYGVLLLMNLKNASFSENFIINLTLISIMALHLLISIIVLIGLIKIFSIKVAKVNTQAEERVGRPHIYTDGLDEGNEKEDEKEQNENAETPKPVLEESEVSRKLIEGIGKLDKLRKEGSISTAEYTKLRAQIIKKYVQ